MSRVTVRLHGAVTIRNPLRAAAESVDAPNPLAQRITRFEEFRDALETDPAGGRPAPATGGMLLCLSGGGFRAAAFHLGAVRRLLELGLFEHITRVRSVSGGSLLAAHIAAVEVKTRRTLEELRYEEEIAAPFRAFLRRDLRTFPVAAHLLWNWWWKRPRLWHLERRLRRRLTDVRLGQIRDIWHFVASDLVSGVEAAFSSDWQYVSELQLIEEQWLAATSPGAEYQGDVREWHLARVALASAAFPPVFGPMRMRVRLDFNQGVGTQSDMALSDGGVVSNLGVPERTGLFSHVLVSDASYPPGWVGFSTWPRRWWRVALRAAMRQGDARALRNLRFGDGTLLCRWVVGGSSEVAERVSRVRTDLDSFSDAEIRILENSGYIEADEWLRELEERGVALAAPHGGTPPNSDWLDDERAARALCGSARRFLKVRTLRRARRRWKKWRNDPLYPPTPYFERDRKADYAAYRQRRAARGRRS